MNREIKAVFTPQDVAEALRAALRSPRVPAHVAPVVDIRTREVVR